MNYTDLLFIPYCKNGRDMQGLDCYGFVIECLKRVGITLKDISATPDGDLEEYITELNVREIKEYKKNCCVQFEKDGRLHIGYMLDKRTCLHMTQGGVRQTPVFCLGEAKYFEVI